MLGTWIWSAKGRAAAALLAACAVAAAAPSHAFPVGKGDALRAQTIVHTIAVFGSDDRKRLPQRLKYLEDKIGLLYEARSRLVCTAFCVGDAMIATASHCINRTQGERPPRLNGFTFYPASSSRKAAARIAGADIGAAAQHIVVGSARLSTRPPIDATRDWAVIKLATPVCRAGGLKIGLRSPSDVISLAAAGRIYQVSYHRDFAPWQLVLGEKCDVRRTFGPGDAVAIKRDFNDSDRLLLHTCDTGGASSGSPLLFDGPGGPEVVGMNVGTYELSRVMMQKGEIVHRFKSDSVANTAVAPQAFGPGVLNLTRASILGDKQSIKDLQAMLISWGDYTGKIDGGYGPDLKAAIEAFEKRNGLPVTGIASHELLHRMAAMRPPASVTQSAGTKQQPAREVARDKPLKTTR